jgi:hypothetical protein
MIEEMILCLELVRSKNIFYKVLLINNNITKMSRKASATLR